jgi:hypothetical protein
LPLTHPIAATTLPLSTRLTRICWQCPSSCRYHYFSRSIRLVPFLPLRPPTLPRRSSLEFSTSVTLAREHRFALVRFNCTAT